ncbi:2-succinylbenzoate--CoA ligase [Ktedonobacteria bacterium brp13]|nr:2-succinylbenzoate--CoA ligase [Ktedonobacteria bacterium brp13]
MNSSEQLLPNWLKRSAENIPTRPAISCEGRTLTFAQLDQQATLLAFQLATLGVHAGSRIAVLTGSGLPYVVCVHALMRIEAILVPLNLRLTTEEQSWLVQDVNASLLIHDAQNAERAHALTTSLATLPHVAIGLDTTTTTVTLSGIAPTEVALSEQITLDATQSIMYTSGTTGKPKGVVITYGMQWWNAIGSALNLGHNPDDCWLACMPLFHIGGLSILMKNVIYGIHISLHEKFDAEAVNTAIREERVTIISVVAIMLQRMLAALDKEQGIPGQGRYPAALRCVLLGGGPAPQPLLEDCARRDIPVMQSYGLTESCSQAATLSPADALRKLGSAGRPLMPVQLRIINDDTLAAPGEPGTICLKGPTITSSYDHRPDATAATIHDGWLSTGDIGYLDADGYLYVLDRRSDLIISGGENIYPAEIEAVLLAHHAVVEAGVCGRDEPTWGQIPIAFVHLTADSTVTEQELLAHAARHLARFKLPQHIYSVAQLPRNSSGKLLRRELHTLLPENR